MKLRNILILAVPVFLLGCSKNQNTTYNPIPTETVNFQVDMNSPLYNGLNAAGGYAYVGGQGYKGVILICDNNNNIDAYDRACPYNYTDECAILTVRPENFDIECGSYLTTTKNNKPVTTFAPCCGSAWNYAGVINNGPTQYAPKRYTVTQNGSILTVTN